MDLTNINELNPSDNAAHGPSDCDDFDPFEDLFDCTRGDTKLILRKLTEGKSLTRINKEFIKQRVIDILTRVEQFCSKYKNLPTPMPASTSSLPASKPTSTPTTDHSIVEVIRDTIKEEISKIQKQIPITHTDSPLSPAPAAPPHASKAPISKSAITISTKTPATNHQETVQAWHRSISFKDTNFAPAGIKYISNNKLMVEFDSPEHREIAINKSKQPLSEVEAEPCKKLKPMIILKGIHKSTTPETLMDIIPIQNDCVKENIADREDFQLKFQRGNKNPNLYNAVFMVTPTLWKAITENGRINISHQRVQAEDHPPLLQCYQCLQFGHTRNKCTQTNPTCSHCSSSSHMYKNCPNKNDPTKIACHNCAQFNKAKNLKSKDTLHSATSNKCPLVQHMINRVRSRTDYGL